MIIQHGNNCGTKRQIRFPLDFLWMLKNTGFLKSVLCSLQCQTFLWGLFGVLWAVLEKVCSEVGLCKSFFLRENEREIHWARYLGTKFALRGANEVFDQECWCNQHFFYGDIWGGRLGAGPRYLMACPKVRQSRLDWHCHGRSVI